MNIVRASGREAQRILIIRWRGLPTTVMLRHRSSLPNAQRARLHSRLQALRGGDLAMPTASEERANPDAADAVYDLAVGILREKTRDTKRFPLLFAELCDYGFRRNLFGVRLYVVTVSATTAVVAIGLVCVSNFAYQPINLAIVAVVSVALMVAVISRVNESWVRDAAESYADALFNALGEL